MSRLLLPALLAACASVPAPSSAPSVLTADQLARDAKTVELVTPIVDAYYNGGPRLLGDGRVVFMSNRDGLPALYVGDTRAPAAAPRRLPGPDERIRHFNVLPDEKVALFTSDVSGDGNFRIFAIGLDGGEVRDLTPGESLNRDVPVVARKAPGLFAYAAHAATDRSARIFVQRVGGAPREIARDDFAGNVEDLAPDGTRLIYSRFINENDHVLFEVDVASGRMTRLFPAEGAHAAVTASGYAADGEHVLVAGNDEGRPSWLVALDRSGRPGARYEETEIPTAAISGFSVAPSGDRLAIVVYAGDHAFVRLLDARTLRAVGRVDAPLGATFATEFTGDGKTLGITASTASAPADLYAADVATGKVTRLRDDARPGLARARGITAAIVAVPAFDGLAIPVNLYLPEGQAGKLPTVVLVHGGPSGSAMVGFDPEVHVLVEAGFAVVQPNIRGSSGFGLAYEQADDREKRGDALRDVASVNAWARAQPWCNGRLAIMGVSYGGYMTLLALTRQPTLWQAGVDASGMSDLKTMEALEDQALHAYDETEFGVLGKQDALLEEWSPLKDISRVVTPVFIYQGVHDPITPREQADRMVAALRARAVPVEYMLIENEGHGVVRRENRIAYLARVVRFLRERL